MTLHQKLLAARGHMSFEKTFNKQLGYEILSADAVLEMVGNALTAEGILFIPSMINAEVTTHPQEKTYNGKTTIKPVQHALAEIEMRFIDVETGEQLVAITHGSAQDYGDKALGKSQSYGIKYFFYRMFLKGKTDINDEERIDATEERKPRITDDPADDNPGVPEWITEDRVSSLVRKARKLWSPGDDMAWPRVYNRVAICAGLPSELNGLTSMGKLTDALYQVCNLSANDVWDNVVAYEEDND